MPEGVLEKSVSPILTVYSQKRKPEKEETLSQITRLVAALELESEALKTESELPGRCSEGDLTIK